MAATFQHMDLGGVLPTAAGCMSENSQHQARRLLFLLLTGLGVPRTIPSLTGLGHSNPTWKRQWFPFYFNGTELPPSLIGSLQFHALLWGHWGSQEALGKVALAFSTCCFYASFYVLHRKTLLCLVKNKTKPHKFWYSGFFLLYLLLKMIGCLLIPTFLNVQF